LSGDERWGEQFLNREWLAMNEELAFKRTARYTSITELRNFCIRVDVSGRII
jgi:hypothetical protein